MNKYLVIALDLEGTLISNAISQFPRPGLYKFLEFCESNFSRIVLFTSVPKNRCQSIALYLVESGNAPLWFEFIEYVNWHGQYKDIQFIDRISSERVLLVDDQEVYIHPQQKQNWILVKEFEPPYTQDDRELDRLIEVLRSRLVENI
jgi:hypothetical protein